MRTSLLKTLLTFTVFLSLSFALVVGGMAEELLDPEMQPKYVNGLPIPARIDVTNGANLTMEMREVTQWLGILDGEMHPLMTTVWGYGQPTAYGRTPMASSGREPRTGPPNQLAASYPGPTFVAMRDVPVDIRWNNKLPNYNMDFPGLGGHLLPVDPTLHMAHPPKGGIPTVVHLHGGHTESASDGLPEAWFTQNFRNRGPHFVKKTYHYDNDQEAATLWYHDHALGITRLNVYAGLAGFYLLRDTNENQLLAGGVLPAHPYEIEIVIQDRMFTEDGELFYPSTDPDIEPGFDPLPEGPSAIAEFFGDFILVNGVAWPMLEVEPRKYRFRFLNGSDSRFYVLEFQDAMMNGTAQSFLQIGTDNGLLENPVSLTRLLLAPGERADLIVDFNGQTELFVRNFGPDEPFKGFNPDGTVSDGQGGVAPPADPATTGQIMKFAVTKPLDTNVAEATVDANTMLRQEITPLVQSGATRNLVLFEGLDNYGRLQPLLGTLGEGSLGWFQPITENPMVNDVEVWEVYNATEDAHPIHLHLVSFQIINRESFEGTVEEKAQPQHDGAEGVGGILTVDSLLGDARPPEDNEMGWKDTAVMLPGEVTRVIARFDREGRYVWHCHILSHEDHEMMRPYYVGPMPLALQGASEAQRTPLGFALEQNYPNPFNPETSISFETPVEGLVELKVFNVRGQEVRTLARQVFSAGRHSIVWDGRDGKGVSVSSGVYFYRMAAVGHTQWKKMVMIR